MDKKILKIMKGVVVKIEIGEDEENGIDERNGREGKKKEKEIEKGKFGIRRKLRRKLLRRLIERNGEIKIFRIKRIRKGWGRLIWKRRIGRFWDWGMLGLRIEGRIKERLWRRRLKRDRLNKRRMLNRDLNLGERMIRLRILFIDCLRRRIFNRIRIDENERLLRKWRLSKIGWRYI